MIQSVLGPIRPDHLGRTLVHDHIFIDGSCWFEKPKDELFKQIASSRVSLEQLDLTRRAYRYSLDDWKLDDEPTAIKELRRFKNAGGGTIFDTTPQMTGRDPIKVKRVAENVGINVVLGCGYYVQASHPPFVSRSTVDQLADRIESDLTQGIEDTRVRAGIIGEIGVSADKMRPNERKVLRAAARAHLRTGAPLTVHTFEPFHPETRQGLDVLDILEGEGMPLEKVYLSHMDALRNRKGPFGLDVDFLSKVTERGAYVSLDGFGTWEWPVGALCYNLVYPTDFERAVGVRELIDAGFGDKILVSHDVCMKTNLRTYGGVGYDHLLVSMPRVFKRYGVGPKELKMILVDNPRTLVT